MNSILDNLDSIYDGIVDGIGAKKSDVYFYTKDNPEDESTVLWTQILPTPIIRNFTTEQKVVSGEVETGDLLLTAIPISNFSRDNLLTSSEEGLQERYWVIEQKAYITVGVTRGYTSWSVHIRLYESVNELIPPGSSNG